MLIYISLYRSDYIFILYSITKYKIPPISTLSVLYSFIHIDISSILYFR
nr:MAG TPA: hypothetical protein [Caudoviricetes sp.]